MNSRVALQLLAPPGMDAHGFRTKTSGQGFGTNRVSMGLFSVGGGGLIIAMLLINVRECSGKVNLGCVH